MNVPIEKHTTSTRDASPAIDWLSPPTHYIDVGHSQVPHRAVGQGPDVLFVHGWPLHGATFRRLLPYLTDAFTCHLIDLPGTGFSRWDASSLISIRDHATTVQRIVAALGLKRYALVAHDSGGTVARWAAHEDDRVAGIVLGNTEIPGHHPFLLQMYLWLGALPGGQSILPRTLSVPWLRDSPFVMGGCFRDPKAAEGTFHELFIEPMIASKRTTAGQLRLLSGFDWSAVDDLAGVHRRSRAPVQLIWGTDDPFFPLDRARPMMDQFAGGAELVTIDGGKLFVHEESPAEFGGAMRPFLERCFA